jgi:hypothetical protein
MRYLIAADAVLVFHFTFIVFCTFGAVLALRWRWVLWLQIPAALWGFYVELSGRICPLTSIENAFRHRAGQSGYQGDFLQHYLLATIYPDGLTRSMQYVLGAVVVAVNVSVYAWLLWRRRR